MRIKYILLIFLFLIEKTVFSQNFMMNCISPDFKNLAFYKYNENKKELYVRPMKSRWSDFCKEMEIDEKNVSCKFDGLILYRSSIKNNNDIIIKKTYKVNFIDYSLVKVTFSSINQNTVEKKNEIQFKCRKIKI